MTGYEEERIAQHYAQATARTPEDHVRTSLAQKAALLRRIQDLHFPDMDRMDPLLRERLPEILTARRRPSVLDVALIADATGVTVEFLISGQDPPDGDPYEELVRALEQGGLSRAWAQRLIVTYVDHLADEVRAYPRVKREACRSSQHCAYHGWCHRCDPERAGMDRAARLIGNRARREPKAEGHTEASI
jgi:hypothetical protein